MYAAMDVGTVLQVEPPFRLDYRQRFLGGGGIVEIDERLAVNHLSEDREVLTEAPHVKILLGRRTQTANLMSGTRCCCHHASSPFKPPALRTTGLLASGLLRLASTSG